MTSKQTEAKQKSSSHTPLTSSFIHCVFLIFPSSFWFHPSPWETIKDDMPKHTLLYISICMPRFSFVCSNTRPHKTILDRETESWKKHTWIENEKKKNWEWPYESGQDLGNQGLSHENAYKCLKAQWPKPHKSTRKWLQTQAWHW